MRGGTKPVDRGGGAVHRRRRAIAVVGALAVAIWLGWWMAHRPAAADSLRPLLSEAAGAASPTLPAKPPQEPMPVMPASAAEITSAAPGGATTATQPSPAERDAGPLIIPIVVVDAANSPVDQATVEVRTHPPHVGSAWVTGGPATVLSTQHLRRP